MILDSYAIKNPWTMMIMLQSASPAVQAMIGPAWSPIIARFACFIVGSMLI